MNASSYTYGSHTELEEEELQMQSPFPSTNSLNRSLPTPQSECIDPDQLFKQSKANDDSQNIQKLIETAKKNEIFLSKKIQVTTEEMISELSSLYCITSALSRVQNSAINEHEHRNLIAMNTILKGELNLFILKRLNLLQSIQLTENDQSNSEEVSTQQHSINNNSLPNIPKYLTPRNIVTDKINRNPPNRFQSISLNIMPGLNYLKNWNTNPETYKLSPIPIHPPQENSSFFITKAGFISQKQQQLPHQIHSPSNASQNTLLNKERSSFTLQQESLNNPQITNLTQKTSNRSDHSDPPINDISHIIGPQQNCGDVASNVSDEIIRENLKQPSRLLTPEFIYSQFDEIQSHLTLHAPEFDQIPAPSSPTATTTTTTQQDFHQFFKNKINEQFTCPHAIQSLVKTTNDTSTIYSSNTNQAEYEQFNYDYQMNKQVFNEHTPTYACKQSKENIIKEQNNNQTPSLQQPVKIESPSETEHLTYSDSLESLAKCGVISEAIIDISEIIDSSRSIYQKLYFENLLSQIESSSLRKIQQPTAKEDNSNQIQSYNQTDQNPSCHNYQPKHYNLSQSINCNIKDFLIPSTQPSDVEQFDNIDDTEHIICSPSERNFGTTAPSQIEQCLSVSHNLLKPYTPNLNLNSVFNTDIPNILNLPQTSIHIPSLIHSSQVTDTVINMSLKKKQEQEQSQLNQSIDIQEKQPSCIELQFEEQGEEFMNNFEDKNENEDSLLFCGTRRDEFNCFTEGVNSLFITQNHFNTNSSEVNQFKELFPQKSIQSKEILHISSEITAFDSDSNEQINKSFQLSIPKCNDKQVSDENNLSIHLTYEKKESEPLTQSKSSTVRMQMQEQAQYLPLALSFYEEIDQEYEKDRLLEANDNYQICRDTILTETNCNEQTDSYNSVLGQQINLCQTLIPSAESDKNELDHLNSIKLISEYEQNNQEQNLNASAVNKSNQTIFSLEQIKTTHSEKRIIQFETNLIYSLSEIQNISHLKKEIEQPQQSHDITQKNSPQIDETNQIQLQDILKDQSDHNLVDLCIETQIKEQIINPVNQGQLLEKESKQEVENKNIDSNHLQSPVSPLHQIEIEHAQIEQNSPTEQKEENLINQQPLLSVDQQSEKSLKEIFLSNMNIKTTLNVETSEINNTPAKEQSLNKIEQSSPSIAAHYNELEEIKQVDDSQISLLKPAQMDLNSQINHDKSFTSTDTNVGKSQSTYSSVNQKRKQYQMKTQQVSSNISGTRLSKNKCGKCSLFQCNCSNLKNKIKEHKSIQQKAEKVEKPLQKQKQFINSSIENKGNIKMLSKQMPTNQQKINDSQKQQQQTEIEEKVSLQIETVTIQTPVNKSNSKVVPEKEFSGMTQKLTKKSKQNSTTNIIEPKQMRNTNQKNA